MFEELSVAVQEKDSLSSELHVRHIAIEQLFKNCAKLPWLQIGRAGVKASNNPVEWELFWGQLSPPKTKKKPQLQADSCGSSKLKRTGNVQTVLMSSVSPRWIFSWTLKSESVLPACSKCFYAEWGVFKTLQRLFFSFPFICCFFLLISLFTLYTWWVVNRLGSVWQCSSCTIGLADWLWCCCGNCCLVNSFSLPLLIAVELVNDYGCSVTLYFSCCAEIRHKRFRGSFHLFYCTLKAVLQIDIS